MIRWRVILPVLLCFTAGCDDEPLDYPNAKGDVIGFVALRTANHKPAADLSGVTATLEGRKRFSVTTDGLGKFQFRNVPAGSYKLVLQREGFDSYENHGLAHLGGAPTIVSTGISPLTLAQKPVETILLWTIEPKQLPDDATSLGRYLSVRVNVFDASRTMLQAVVFVSDRPGVSPSNYLSVYPGWIYENDDEPGYFDGAFSSLRNPLISGQTYYARIYTYNGATSSVNPENGKSVYPSLGSSGDEKAFVAL